MFTYMSNQIQPWTDKNSKTARNIGVYILQMKNKRYCDKCTDNYNDQKQKKLFLVSQASVPDNLAVAPLINHYTIQ